MIGHRVAVVKGQPVAMWTWDGGKSWASDPKDILAYQSRKEKALATRFTAKEFHWIDLLLDGPPEWIESRDVKAAI